MIRLIGEFFHLLNAMTGRREFEARQLLADVPRITVCAPSDLTGRGHRFRVSQCSDGVKPARVVFCVRMKKGSFVPESIY